MKIEDIRLQNARYLAKQAGKFAAFGEKIGVDASRVSQIIGKKPVKNIGSATARQIEAAFGKKEGWLDELHDQSQDGKVAQDVAPYIVPGSQVRSGRIAPGGKAIGLDASDFVTVEELNRMMEVFCKLSPLARQNVFKSAQVALSIPLPRGKIRRDQP